ncbi:proteasome subunit beta type-4-like protein [Trifolium pratense]|uniref:Proteasome subunit beta type-4-like protein n=1 Tax=Trifolium pratense TaxID=57577 RepID=A0A2K3LLG3_TRIPR|nr:proteasome subunit beta type-4-like protein [Trifolium pratense]
MLFRWDLLYHCLVCCLPCKRQHTRQLYPYLTGSFVVAMDSVADSQRTLYPYVTGSSVVAIKYKDGILMAADMGGLMLNLFNTY